MSVTDAVFLRASDLFICLWAGFIPIKSFVSYQNTDWRRWTPIIGAVSLNDAADCKIIYRNLNIPILAQNYFKIIQKCPLIIALNKFRP